MSLERQQAPRGTKVLWALGLVLLFAGCATQSAATAPGDETSQAPSSNCVAEVQDSEDECLQVVPVSGECSSPDAVHAERAWLSRHYPGSQVVSQAVASPVVGGPAAVRDHVLVRTAAGEELGLCFDITAFW